MKLSMLLVTCCGLLAAVGCEEKRVEPVKPVGTTTTDAMKNAADKTAAGVKDAAKTTADAAKGAVDKTKEAAAGGLNTVADKANQMLAGEVRTMSGRISAQIAQLKTGGSALTGPQKTSFDAEVATLEAQHRTLADEVTGAGSLSGEALSARFASFKDRGNKLLDGIKIVAQKYNITLST